MKLVGSKKRGSCEVDTASEEVGDDQSIEGMGKMQGGS